MRLQVSSEPLRWWEWLGFGAGGLLVAVSTYAFIVVVFILADALGLS